MGLTMTAVCLAFYYIGMGRVLDVVVIDIPWGLFWGTFGVALVTVCLAILIPTLGSLRQPAPKVLARLAAD